MVRQISLWESDRTSMEDSIELSFASLRAYAEGYAHWAIAYSGGKDSSATVAFVMWAIALGKVKAPKSLTVLYADTRQELPPLAKTAHRLIADLNQHENVTAKSVLPELDDRFYVYMLGRGVPPPTNKFRWCTSRIKITPMADELARMATDDKKFLMITGVRLGESANRDARISISCNSDSGECGQGWFQQMSDNAISDTLAPLVHWRTCHVWDFLYFWGGDAFPKRFGFTHGHRFDYLADIAAAYGDADKEARTGCIGCNLVNKDVALENLVHQYGKLEYTPLLEIKLLLRKMRNQKYRLRKLFPEMTKAGHYAKKGQRLGPLSLESRLHFLERILDIQARAGVDLINAEEEARIRELIELKTFPDGWEGGLEANNHVMGDEVINAMKGIGAELIVQPLMLDIVKYWGDKEE